MVDWFGWWRGREGASATQDDDGQTPLHLRAPKVFSRNWRIREISFAEGVTQSRMLRFAPDRLLVGYTRTMLGALVLRPNPLRIGILGLGGGSQVKWCYRHLPHAQIEVAEINPHVIAQRGRFRIPADDARLQVLCTDGAKWLSERAGSFDLLLVDGYDESGIPQALSTPAFHANCRAALAAGGVMASNLYAPDLRPHIAKLRTAFGQHMRLLDEPRMRNQVMLGWDAQLHLPPRVTAQRAAEGMSGKGFRELRDVFERVASELNRPR